MQYLLMIYQNEAEYGKIDAATAKKMLEEYGAFTQSIIQSGNFKAGDRLQPTHDRDHRARARRQDADDRRSVRGDARAARRLLSGRGQGSRRSARDRRAHSRREVRLDRGAADLGL